MIRLLESATDFAQQGRFEVKGRQVDRWTGTIDLAKITDSEDKTAARQLREAGLGKVPAEVGIDDHGRLVHLGFQLDLAKAAAATGQDAPGADVAPVVTFVLELSDFGVDLHLQAPPASQVDDGTTSTTAAAQ
jgi:hypothetical protein